MVRMRTLDFNLRVMLAFGIRSSLYLVTFLFSLIFRLGVLIFSLRFVSIKLWLKQLFFLELLGSKMMVVTRPCWMQPCFLIRLFLRVFLIFYIFISLCKTTIKNLPLFRENRRKLGIRSLSRGLGRSLGAKIR